jgi:hypothetical protein
MMSAAADGVQANIFTYNFSRIYPSATTAKSGSVRACTRVAFLLSLGECGVERVGEGLKQVSHY